MVIGVAGKGGVGKSTFSSILIRNITNKRDNIILAVDADSNSTLAQMLGVEIDGRLHVVPAPLPVAPGQTRDVQVEVQRDVISVAPAAGGGVWSRPLYASLIIIGGAIILGLLLEQALDEDVPVSPSTPI